MKSIGPMYRLVVKGMFTRSPRGASALTLAVIAIGCAKSRPAPPEVPGQHWTRVQSPEAEGWSSIKLGMVRTLVRDLDTTGLMVVVRGRVLSEAGDVAHAAPVASVRKSILGMLLGPQVARGAVRLEASLADLGIDDVGALTPGERAATVADLMATRSGVYHAASNPGDDLKHAPLRGSKRHGEWFLYSNWNFNVLGTIFERAAVIAHQATGTGRDVPVRNYRSLVDLVVASRCEGRCPR